jgi:phage replication-related protein YjqB (UPF0714/DUF867 family)
MATATATVSVEDADFPCPGDGTYAGLIHCREHCSVAPDVLEALGLDPARIAALADAPLNALDGDNPNYYPYHYRFQVRICGNPAEPASHALFTVVSADADPGAVRMGAVGLTKLGSNVTDGADVTIDTQCPHPTYTHAEAASHGELVERLIDDPAAGLIVVAPHGGMIEEWTDEQAARVVDALADRGRRASLWLCRGWDGSVGAFTRWHVTSTDLHEAGFPGLAAAMSRGYARAISFHGCGGCVYDGSARQVIIGGSNTDAPIVVDGTDSTVGAALQSAIDAITGLDDVVVATSGSFAAQNPVNVVNRLAGGRGIQIEQSEAARTDHWAAIADAVAAVYDAYLFTS